MLGCVQGLLILAEGNLFKRGDLLLNGDLLLLGVRLMLLDGQLLLLLMEEPIVVG